MTDLNSRPFRPDPQQCCEACVFGKGEHSEFCERVPVVTIFYRPSPDMDAWIEALGRVPLAPGTFIPSCRGFNGDDLTVFTISIFG